MQDVRLALRLFRATPAVTAVAVLSLALGIGATTAIFSLANALLLRTLPVADPQRLVTVSSDFALDHGYKNGLGWNYAMWDRFRQRADAFDGAYVWTWSNFNVASSGERSTVKGMIASGDFFRTVGVRAFLGRTFTPADDVRGGGPDGAVAVISHGFWQRQFGGESGIVGRTLTLDKVPFTIVGVTPPEFFGIEVGEVFDVIVPLGTDQLLKGSNTLLDKPNALLLTPMLRLKPSQSIESAVSTLRAMQPAIIDAGRSNSPRFAKEAYVLVPAATGSTDKTLLRQQYAGPLLTIAAVVALVLLITCGNIANLLLARATDRRHELSVRVALGASRWRLGRPLFVESLVLAGAGATLGLIVAEWGARLIMSQISVPGGPATLDLGLDGRVLGFDAAVAVMTAIVFGTAPALRASRVAPIEAMKEQGRSASSGRKSTFSSSLVVAQVASSLALLVAAGLFVGTFEQLRQTPVGYNGDGVVVATVDLGRANPDPSQRGAFIDRLVAATSTTSGVEAAAASLFTPGLGGGANLMVDALGKAVADEQRVVTNAVTPGWFSTFGIALRAGRDVQAGDTASSPPIVVVNETYARRFFPGQNVVGLLFDDGSTPAKQPTIVGVVSDVVYGSPRNAVPPTAYVPLAQSAGLVVPGGRSSVQVSARQRGMAPAPLTRSLGAAFLAVDPKLEFSFRIVADSLSSAVARERLLATLSSFFGAFALLLAALGLYGVTSYAVSRRRSEVGVRLALGATPNSVVRLALSRLARLLGFGIVLGGIGSIWLSRYLGSLLYGLEPGDPRIFAVAVAVLVLTGLLAGWMPARRASRIDPAAILREN